MRLIPEFDARIDYRKLHDLFARSELGKAIDETIVLDKKVVKVQKCRQGFG